MHMTDSHIWPVTAGVDGGGRLTIGGRALTELAAAHGTPLYVLDEATIRAMCGAYRDALARHYPGPSDVHYACKALLNTALARLMDDEGLGLDVVSGGELYVALRAGVAPERVHLHGNAKTLAELEEALAAGVGHIVVDNLDELDLLTRLTDGRGTPQPIMFRLTPEIAPDTHAHIQTGQASSKFGLPLAALDEAAARALAAPGLRLEGLHAHLGSQIFDDGVYAVAIGVLLDCAARLRDRFGLATAAISPGGGLGVPYTAERPLPDVDAYASRLGRALAEGCAARRLSLPRLIVEPGRSIVARAGVALYTVLGSKPLPRLADRRSSIDNRQAHRTPDATGPDTLPSPAVHRLSSVSRYLHIDGGMGDNIRPALYEARYTALLANRAAAAPEEVVHVAGRYCESGDVLLRDIALPRALVGDLLAVAGAGAYTLSMASNYNLVPRPAVLLVRDGEARLIQRRETYADIAARDVDWGEPTSDTQTGG